jgi:hypothetical protein
MKTVKECRHWWILDHPETEHNTAAKCSRCGVSREYVHNTADDASNWHLTPATRGRKK